MSLALSAALRRQPTSIYISNLLHSISPLSLFLCVLFLRPLSLSLSVSLLISLLLSHLIGAYALMNADRLRPDTMCSPIIMLLYLWVVIVRV